MKQFEIHFGDYRDPSVYLTEATNHLQAIKNLRKELGYNRLKVQKVYEITDNSRIQVNLFR